jgi:hypothetical protein
VIYPPRKFDPAEPGNFSRAYTRAPARLDSSEFSPTAGWKFPPGGSGGPLDPGEFLILNTDRGVSTVGIGLHAVGIHVMTNSAAKRGRKPKGNRKPVRAMLPAEVVDIADAMAKEHEDLDRTAVLGRLLCERLGLPVPAYCLPRSSSQQELPLNKAS